jgi:hypothetical protein
MTRIETSAHPELAQPCAVFFFVPHNSCNPWQLLHLPLLAKVRTGEFPEKSPRLQSSLWL